MNAGELLTKSVHSPFGIQKIYTARGEAPSFRVGWMDGLDGVSKVSFNFLYTLRVYRSCIYILIYMVKSCPHKFLVGLKCWSSWGVRMQKFKNTL